MFPHRVDKNSEQNVMDPLSFENISMTEDWVTGKDMCLDDNGSFDWMELDSTSASTMLLGPSNDDADDLGSGNFILGCGYMLKTKLNFVLNHIVH